MSNVQQSETKYSPSATTPPFIQQPLSYQSQLVSHDSPPTSRTASNDPDLVRSGISDLKSLEKTPYDYFGDNRAVPM